MKEEKEKQQKRRKAVGLILITCLVILSVIFGAIFGFVAGIHYAAQEYVSVLAMIFENSDVKMNINMTLNQTQMMDYMIDKMGILNNKTTTQKEYIAPCSPDPTVPRGQTDSRCINEQVIGGGG
jgi:flagellar basal body-associated protein FliL